MAFVIGACWRGVLQYRSSVPDVAVLIGSTEWRTARYVVDIRNRVGLDDDLTDMPCVKGLKRKNTNENCL